ncbi:hypothetical protein B0H14DRAFT_3440116 [Mycena olivaceomarginata]|nr:hypothetical protein B0H14DRAFT_3440116 [Mycena olivaceomarginata]
MGEPGRDDRSARKRRRSVHGGMKWMGAWTGAAAQERHYLLGGFTPLLEAACGQLHAALGCSAGRDHRDITRSLARVLPFLQVSFAGGSSLVTFLPPFLIRPVYPHSPQAITTLASSDRSTSSTASWATKRAHEYKNLIPMFGIVNEAYLPGIGRCVLTSFYLQAHDTIRCIAGYGAGDGPFVSIHDGSQGTRSDHLDTGGIWPKHACSSRGPSLNTSRSVFGVTLAGDFSNGYNDCELYLTGVNGMQHYAGREHMEQASVKQLALASMDTTRDWFFSMRKIGPVLDGVACSPLWTIASVAVQSHGQRSPATPLTPRPRRRTAAAGIASLAFVTPLAGCTYPDTWSAIGLLVPGVCTETPSRSSGLPLFVVLSFG